MVVLAQSRRRNQLALTSRAYIFPLIGLIAWLVIPAVFLGASGASATECAHSLSGRSIKPDTIQRAFGLVQGFPQLPLTANEYLVTIDDGPNPATTRQLLAVLRAYCVKATFFLTGQNALAHPDLVKEISAEGHAIGSHSFRHPDLAKLTEAEILVEMRQGREAVGRAAYGEGHADGRPRLTRLPGSNNTSPYPSPGLIEGLQREGVTIAGYDLSPQDWRNSPPQESFNRLFHAIRDRGVIVFHDGQSNTIALLPMVLDELGRRGAKIVALAP